MYIKPTVPRKERRRLVTATTDNNLTLLSIELLKTSLTKSGTNTATARMYTVEKAIVRELYP
jgi:tryptophanase